MSVYLLENALLFDKLRWSVSLGPFSMALVEVTNCDLQSGDADSKEPREVRM